MMRIVIKPLTILRNWMVPPNTLRTYEGKHNYGTALAHSVDLFLENGRYKPNEQISKEKK